MNKNRIAQFIKYNIIVWIAVLFIIVVMFFYEILIFQTEFIQHLKTAYVF